MEAWAQEVIRVVIDVINRVSNIDVLLAMIGQIADLSIIRDCSRQADVVECDGATRLPSWLKHRRPFAPRARCQPKEGAEGPELN